VAAVLGSAGIAGEHASHAAESIVGGVLAGDTIVEVEGQMLGKPADRQEAATMLRRLSGRIHRVASSVALLELSTGAIVSGVAVSEVRFDDLDEAGLASYLDSEEWSGKAGAYAIQGDAGDFAHLVSGDMDTVIGLPMELVRELAAVYAQPGRGPSSDDSRSAPEVPGR
jgi:septum formation protein